MNTATAKKAKLSRTAQKLAKADYGALEARVLAAQQPSEAELLGLVEVPGAPGSPYKMLTTRDGAVPNLAQRVAMAKRAQELGAQCAYVQTRAIREQQEQQQGKQQHQPPQERAMTTEKLDQAAAAGVLPKPQDVQKAFDANQKEVAKREAAEKKAAAEKAKAEEAARKKAAKQRKAAKALDVTPRASAKPAATKDRTTSVATRQPSVKGGRPAKAEDPNQQYVVLKDNTRSGHMKTFMTEATRLKKFTRAQLVAATKSKVTADRAERYFDYCLYKKLIKAA